MLEQMNTHFIFTISYKSILKQYCVVAQLIHNEYYQNHYISPHGPVTLMIMACIYDPDGVSLPSTIDLASSLLIDGLGHMHEEKSISTV